MNNAKPIGGEKARHIDIGSLVNTDSAPLLIKVYTSGEEFGWMANDNTEWFNGFDSVGSAIDHAIEYYSA
jgi:hypothetical protein